MLIWKRFGDRLLVLNHRRRGLRMWFEAGDDGADDGAIGMYFSRDVHNRGIRESGIDIRASS